MGSRVRPGRWKGSGRELVGTVGRSQTEAPDPAAPRYAFLLDKALLICKRRGDSYDLKDFINLHSFQVRDDSSGERDNKKVRLRPEPETPLLGSPSGRDTPLSLWNSRVCVCVGG